MLRKSLILLVLLFEISFVSAQKNSDILFSLNNQNIALREFKFIYEKNNKKEEDKYTEKNVREYLDLYIKFKMKVKDAYDQGIDTSADFVKEFSKYRKQVAEGYFVDKTVINKLSKEAYDRMLWEINASHILIFSKPDDLPADTLKAYKKIEEARKKIVEGDDFEKIATEYSEDPSVKKNKGNLGFFTVFQMIYSFENQAYKTNVGQVSKIFKTRFGYHILKVNKKRKNRGEIQTAIILIKNNPKFPQIVKNKINNIHNELKLGKNFEELVEKYSEDKATKSKKGRLTVFGSLTNYLPENLKDAAFSLKKNGDFSEPILTNFGWVIIKRIELKPMMQYEKLEKTIKNKVERDSRATLAANKRIKQIKKENKYKEYLKNANIFHKIVDSSLLAGSWKLNSSENLNKIILKINKQKYTQSDFAKYLEKKQQKGAYKNLEYALNKYLKLFNKEMLFKYEDENLENKYPDFKNLISEYKEGILLFTISDLKVWGKASKDTIGLKKYYQNHKEKYKYGQRIDADILSCKNQNIVEQVQNMLKEGKKAEEIYTELNKQNALNLSHKNDKFEKGDNKILDDFFNKEKGVYTNGLNVIIINDLLKPKLREFDSIKGLVMTDYQKDIEENWIKELEAKYKVKINEKVLKSIIKN